MRAAAPPAVAMSRLRTTPKPATRGGRREAGQHSAAPDVGRWPTPGVHRLPGLLGAALGARVHRDDAVPAAPGGRPIHDCRCAMTSFEELLGALRGVPALPGAQCRNRGHLFDPPAPREAADDVAQRHMQALWLCDNCPARRPCEQWLDSLPPARRPAGVVAGRIVNQPKPRKRKVNR